MLRAVRSVPAEARAVNPIASLAVGVVAGASFAAVLAWRKRSALLDRAALLQAALESDGDATTALLVQGGEELRTDLQRAGDAYARTVAEREAERVLGEVYGLTPARIRALGVAANTIETVAAQVRAAWT